MLYIHSSNRLEKLVALLAQVVKIPLPHPLAQELIVVQSRGMERWIAMELAQRLGIWANGLFPFPQSALWRIFKEVLGYLPDISQFDQEVMMWNLMEILPHFLENTSSTELHHYLENDLHGMKRYQLVIRLAEVFDQYLLYRPEWIDAWEKGKQPDELENHAQASWQAHLWRSLTQRYGSHHRTKIREFFFQKLPRSVQNLPPRLSIFGIPALPPFYLEVLVQLSQRLDIHMFLLNPCQEYWGDIVSDAEIARRTRRSLEKPKTPEEQYLEKGNSLLASMGKLGRDFLDSILEYPHHAKEYFEEPGEQTLLACVQSDILHLRESPHSPLTVDLTASHSIQIHACHSAMREVEVLHDQLLALFEENPHLLPKDILVMTPDIETYAPFVQAVFATTPQEAKQIPFCIADRSLRGKSLLVNTFLAILELNSRRFSVSEIWVIFEVHAVQKRFGLVEQDLDLIRHWITQTGIRWGMDAQSRQEMNLPAFEENTWRAGLNRLLLGCALPHSPLFHPLSQGEGLFNNILPFGELEGHETLILGKFIAFIDHLHRYVKQLDEHRTLPQWIEFLNKLLNRFFLPEEEHEEELQQVRNILNKLLDQGKNLTHTLSSQVILAYLHHHLEIEPQPTLFLTGRVTFCTMLPMRSIPSKVICLLGMNDKTYPRPNKTLSFDLMDQCPPRRGDRSHRQYDRYLFLEALLSAREYFYISYIGHSIQDNTPLPPCGLVSELLDYLQKNYPHIERVTHHPLQPFSPRYFNHSDRRLFSFSEEYCLASTISLKERKALRTFFQEPLSQVSPSSRVNIEQLVRFFLHPTKFLLKERLGIILHTPQGEINETEPFDMQELERYQFKQTLVEKSLQGYDLNKYFVMAKATGQLPHGRVGEYVYSQTRRQIYPFVEKVQHILAQQTPINPYLIDWNIEGMRLTGQIDHLWSQYLIHYRCTSLNAKDHIRLWIAHLLMNCSTKLEMPRHSLLIGEEMIWEYLPVENAQEILVWLMKNYHQGLIQPLLFFPESSMKFIQSFKKLNDEEGALLQAKKHWQEKEREDKYYQWCFGPESTPLEDEQFKQLARQFFEPLLTYQRNKE